MYVPGAAWEGGRVAVNAPFDLRLLFCFWLPALVIEAVPVGYGISCASAREIPTPTAKYTNTLYLVIRAAVIISVTSVVSPRSTVTERNSQSVCQ